MPPLIDTLVLTSAESNCYIVGDRNSNEAIIIDAGGEAERIAHRVSELDLQPKLVVITHAHWDHVNAAGALSVRYNVQVAMHPADVPLLAEAPEVTRARTGIAGPDPPSVGVPLAEASHIAVGDVSFRVLHTPGHTPGSVCLLGDGVLFTGDTLMAGWVGRTDLPGGDQSAIRSSLWDRLLRLPDETLVYAGHLAPTNIGTERLQNPYLNGKLPLR